MFRFVIFALAVVGLYSVFSGAVGATAVGVAALFLVPLIVLKLFILMTVAGVVAHRIRGGDFRHRGRRRSGRVPGQSQPPEEERFDEWHRLAHAREEVEGWVAGMPDVGQD